MEPGIWKQMLWTVGFLCATYLPVQFLALRKLRGAARVAAAVPLLFMAPMIVAGLRPEAYRDGSLYMMYFGCPYLPVMIYLLAVSYLDPRRPSVCPHCGHKTRVRSFQRARSAGPCAKCGKDLSGNATAESARG
jgi:ribosomal protein L37AE/L43A